MRLPRALRPLRLILTILLTYLTCATTQSQTHLVCRRLGSQNCLVWIVDNISDLQIEISKLKISPFCGFSKVWPKESVTKYIQVQEFETKSKQKVMYCHKIINIGHLFDLHEVTRKLETPKRKKRQTYITPRGRYRGQTQSQYLAIDRGNGKDEGKAEAQSAADSSRASVSGNSGMGQAQSQSIYDPSCDDCYRRSYEEVENLKRLGEQKPGQNGNRIEPPHNVYNQNTPNYYGVTSNVPALGQAGSPGSKGNGIQMFTPLDKGLPPPGSNGFGHNIPLSPNGGYSPNNYQVSGYKPITDSYVPADVVGNKNVGPNGITGFQPNINGHSNMYPQDGSVGPGAISNPNTGLTVNNKQPPYQPGGANFDPYKPHRIESSNYFPGNNVDQPNAPPGNVLFGPGNEYRPQIGAGNYGSGIPNTLISRVGEPGTHVNPGYAPGSLTSVPSSGTRPENESKQNPAVVHQRVAEAQWPLAAGPYSEQGGGNVYCCIVPNNMQNGNMYPNNFYRTDKLDAHNLVSPGTALNGNNLLPGVKYGTNQYVPGGTATNSYIPNNNVGITVPQGSISMPGGQYVDSARPYGTIDGQYKPIGPGGTLPSGQYIPTGTGGSTFSSGPPGGQYIKGNVGPPIGTGSQYGQGGPTGVQYVTGGNEPTGTAVHYGPTNSGDALIPGAQYGASSGIPTGQQYGSVSPGQYGSGNAPDIYEPSVSSGVIGSRPYGISRQNGAVGPNAAVNPYAYDNFGILPRFGLSGEKRPTNGIAGTTGPYGAGGQYRPGSTGVPIGNTGVYGSSGSVGPSGTPISNIGPGSQYDTRIPGSNVGFENHYVPDGSHRPVGSSGNFSPGNTGEFVPKYEPGPASGSVVPSGQYGVGQGGIPIGNTGQYAPGSLSPGRQYNNGGTGGLIESPGQYNPEISPDPARQGRPGGQYTSNSPGNSEGLGIYGPNGVGNTQYSPNSLVTSSGSGKPYNSNLGQYGPIGSGNQEIPGGQTGPGGVRVSLPSAGQDPQAGVPYGHYNNDGIGQNINYNGVPQNFIDPNSINAENDDSDAEASVAQNINGTTANASSKGGNDKGRAQTSVQGTYTGSGSFQAQAQITGENKEAQSEVSGGRKGASSSASGNGRNNKSQANVQLGSETGSIQTQSQSNGVMHSSNSQVQGSVKGGMADAQARGPGSTSSQAQIGFTPYKDTERAKYDQQKIPFVGGGMASAQSSGRTGQSQSQLHGTFKYGISYNGAAQSGASLDKDAVFPNRLSYEKINVFDEKEKNIDVDKIAFDANETSHFFNTSSSSRVTSELPVPDLIKNKEISQEYTTESILTESMTNSESRNIGHSHSDHHMLQPSYTTNPNGSTLSSIRKSFQTNFQTIPDYEFTTDKEDTRIPEYDSEVGYDGDGNDANDVDQTEYSNSDEYSKGAPTPQYLQSTNRNFPQKFDVHQTTGENTQHIVIDSLKDHNAEIIQKDSERPDERKVYQPGERIPGTGGYTIPVGFTGSVTSVASKDKTYVVGSKESPSQAQTVTLTPGTGKVRYPPSSSSGKYVKPKNLRSLESPKEDDNKYVSVSKSVTRALDGDNNIRKQYSHTYYTKSSSCGYFTFTCTMVTSAEGKKKVCKPKMPTNPDGTPIRC